MSLLRQLPRAHNTFQKLKTKAKDFLIFLFNLIQVEIKQKDKSNAIKENKHLILTTSILQQTQYLLTSYLKVKTKSAHQEHASFKRTLIIDQEKTIFINLITAPYYQLLLSKVTWS